MFQWRRTVVYETMGWDFYQLLKDVGGEFYPLITADGCLDSQAEDSWLFS